MLVVACQSDCVLGSVGALFKKSALRLLSQVATRLNVERKEIQELDLKRFRLFLTPREHFLIEYFDNLDSCIGDVLVSGLSVGLTSPMGRRKVGERKKTNQIC